MLSVGALPDKFLSTVDEPLDVYIAPLNNDATADMLVLGSGGDMTVALNGGDDTWNNVSTTDLGIGSADGFTLARVDGDAPLDLLVQNGDGIHIFMGDGNAGFNLSQTIAADTPGTWATSDGRPVGMAATLLNNDAATDLVSISPGTDEMLVLLGNGDGTLAAPIRYASGADEPVTVAVGNFLGDALPDVAVGHADGTVTFFEGTADGGLTLRSELSQTGLGSIKDLAAEDFDYDGDLDLVVSGTDQVTMLLGDDDALTSSPIANGDFSSGLTGWETEIVGQAPGELPGTVNALGGVAQLTENGSFLTTLKQTFVVPPTPETLSLDVVSLGLEDPAGGIPDALEISLLGANMDSVVNTFHPDATSFFNANPNGVVSLASGVTFDGTTISVDISSLTPGTEVTLYIDLVGNPPGDSSTATIDNVRISPDTILADTMSPASGVLDGPFVGAAGLSLGDVDGDGNLDIVVADGGADKLYVFNGDGLGGYVRSEIDVAGYGTGALAVATGPLTAGDEIEDVVVTLYGSDGVLTPLSSDVTGPTVTFVDPVPSELVTGSLTEIHLQFSEAVLDDGPTVPHSVTNPAAYQLINAGLN
ncbi:MAG: VCBS repeat-containing protein, partial [Planctomycetia bacterium]